MSQERSDAKHPLLIRAACRQKPFDYAIYTLANPDERMVHHVERPTFVWKSRLKSIFKT